MHDGQRLQVMKTVSLSSGHTLNLLQKRTGHSAMQLPNNGPGGTVWPAGEALVQWLAAQRTGTHASLVPEVASATIGSVLELGTGTGVVSIALALLGASSVIATDGDPPSCELCRTNAAASGVPDLVVTPFVWGSAQHLDDALGSNDGRCPNWIICADVVYSNESSAALELSLRALLARGGCALVVIGWVARGHHEEAFLSRLTDLGSVSTVERISDARFGYLTMTRRGGQLVHGAAVEFGITMLRVRAEVTAGLDPCLRQWCGLMRARAAVATCRDVLPCWRREAARAV